jgi:hypothetical protein
MRVEPLEPPEHLAQQVPDVTPNPPPRRPGTRLPPLFERARGDLQQVRDLLPGHDLYVLVCHNRQERHGIP